LQIIVAGIRNPRSHVPGPWWARFTSIPAEVYRFRGRRLLLTADLHRRYGPVVLFSPNQVYIGDVEGFHQIHRMGTPFLKGAYHAPIQFGGDLALFSLADPKVHAGRRRLFARAFTLPSLRQNWEREIRAKVDLCINQMKREAAQGASDTYKWWRLLTSDVIAKMAFGESFGLLEAGKKNDYVLALEKAGLNIVLKLMLPAIQPLLQFVPLKAVRDVVKADNFIYDKGAVAVENLRNGRREQQTIFNNMLDAADKTDSILRDESVRAEAAVFMVAGSDTTAVTMTYLFWSVLKRPDLQQRLEAEVAKLRPDFTDEDVAQLPLVNNIIDETLRLYGPGNGPSVRYVPPGGATFHGIYLPEDTLVFTNAHVLHRDESAFPDVERFVCNVI
jgi:cytochrome P450